MAALFALVAIAASPMAAAENQPESAVPEVPAGSNPEPNGDTGQPGQEGQPESNSAVPEVPAGANPQPNP